jgi:hypothetical protein
MPSTGVRCRCPRRSAATPPSQPLAALVVVAVPVGRGAAATGAGALTTLKHFRFARRRSTLPQVVPTRERTRHGCSLGSVRPVLDLDVKGDAGGLVTWERAGELGRAAGDHAEVELLRLTGASLFVRAPSAGARSWTASPSLTTSNTRCVPRAGSSRDGRPGWGGQLILQQALEDEAATSWGRDRQADGVTPGPPSIATASSPRTATTTGGPIDVERPRLPNAQALGMGR